jgi:histidine phosphotransferase ChpT
LASPISAIQAGLELLELAGLKPSPEVTLLKDSIKSATSRVEFFRIAYGSAAQGAEISTSEITRILNGGLGVGRTQVDWDAAGNVKRSTAKWTFLMLQCLERLLPVGGRIRVTSNGDAWQFLAKGPRLADDLSFLKLLDGSQTDVKISPAEIQFLLVMDEMAKLVCPPHIHIGEGEITISVSQALKAG